MSDTLSRLENQLLHFSKLQKWDKVESLWTQLAEAEAAPDSKFFATLAKRAQNAEKGEDFKSWSKLLLEEYQTSGKNKNIVTMARGILRVFPDFEDLRQPLIDTLRQRYKNQDRLEEYLDLSGILDAPEMSQGLGRFLQFIQYAEGQVFRHGDWGIGKVTAVDLEGRQVEITFKEMGAKTFSFDGVKDFLKKIPRKHFIAQRLLNPEKLADQARKKPVEFLKFVLKNQGGVIYRADLKQEFLQGIFTEKEWNNWWGKNRDAFRFDPYIGFSGSVANPKLELRKEPKSFHEEMLQDFIKADSFSRRYTLAMDMVKLQEKDPIPKKVVNRLFDTIQRSVQELDRSNHGQRLEYRYLLDDLKAALPEAPEPKLASSREILSAARNPAQVVNSISNYDYQVRAAREVEEKMPKIWGEMVEPLFLGAPVRFGQWVLKAALEQGDREHAIHMAEQLLHRPEENTDLFMWLLRSVREGKYAELNIEISIRDLFNAILGLIDSCHLRVEREDSESTRLKGVISRLQNLLMENHHALVTELFETFDLDEARQRHQEIMDKPALGETFKLSFDSAVRSLHPKLEESGQGSDAQEHLVTPESLEVRQKEFQKLKNEEIPENSKAIGAAAALGDLSENAEYESAKERQKVLFRRLESLEDLLQRARVVEPEVLDTTSIGFGMRFKIRNLDSGDVEVFTLLGIWDANPEKNVLSYHTPFARQFLNHKVGDNLVINHPGGGSSRFEVLSIENALLAGTS